MKILGVLFVLVASFFLYGVRNTKKVVLQEVPVYFGDKEKNAAGVETALSVLQLSDLHLENISVKPKMLYNLLKNEKIDLIVLTGDFLDTERRIPKLVPYLRVLTQLNAAYGTYAVFGNHDYLLDQRQFDRLQSVLEDNGVTVLRNEHDSIMVNGQRLNVIGIDDHCTKHSDIAKAFAPVGDGYRLVVTHDPNIVLDMDHVEFDYMVTGHFHGGQIYWPKPYHLGAMGGLVRMNIIKGLNEYQGKRFYINEGLGQTLFNIRIGSRPEITLHQLKWPNATSPEQSQTAQHQPDPVERKQAGHGQIPVAI